MWIARFERDLYVTRHARERMAQRAITEALLLDLLETGYVRYKDSSRLWVARAYPDRSDNMMCGGRA